MAKSALRIYAGPKALAHLQAHGLKPEHVGVVPAAAGGPKGLILGPLDRFVFGQWLAQSTQTVHLVGASIGAWRSAAMCLPEPALASLQLEHDYIHQHYEPAPGQRRLTPEAVSAQFAHSLQAFFGGREAQVLSHPRLRLHLLASRGRHLLQREQRWRTPLAFGAAALCNLVSRQALGWWLERVVFSSAPASAPEHCAELPFASHDFPTRQVRLQTDNLLSVLQASCAIPLVLQAVHDIAHAPAAAYWDGGITDYHLHLNYAAWANAQAQTQSTSPLVLYPHFQSSVVPGWLDKALPWRHGATAYLDHCILLCPDPAWVRALPRGKLPDRSDFAYFGDNLAERVRQWQAAVAASQQLADDFQAWLARLQAGSLQDVQALA